MHDSTHTDIDSNMFSVCVAIKLDIEFFTKGLATLHRWCVAICCSSVFKFRTWRLNNDPCDDAGHKREDCGHHKVGGEVETSKWINTEFG